MDNNFSDILNIFKTLNEGNEFAGQAVGQKPGDQWRGTDVGTPGNKLVGASESVEECGEQMTLADKLRARWEETKREKGLQEYGMTTGGTTMAGGNAGTNNPTANPAAQAKDIAQTQQKVNTLKSAGVNIPNVGQAVKSALKDPSEPATTQDRQVAGGLGQEVEQLLAKGDPGTVNQLAALIRKNKQAGAQ
jgi:hypothetical protein